MKVRWRHKFSNKEGSSEKESFEKWAKQHPSDAARYEIIGEYDDTKPMIVDLPDESQQNEEEE